LEQIKELGAKIAFEIEGIRNAVKLAHQPPIAQRREWRPTPVPLPSKQTMRVGMERLANRPNGTGDATLGKAERRILAALKQNHPERLAKRRVALLAGYALRGGAFNNAIGRCRSLGYVVGSEPIQITDAGIEAAGEVEPLPFGEDLARYWLAHPDLGRAEREILRVLLDTDRPLTKQEIAEQTTSNDGTPYEASGGAFNNSLGRLRTLQLVNGDGNALAAAPELRATA